MAEKKAKRIRYTTPAGIASFPKLRTPDTKFNSDGAYGVKLVLDPNDAEAQKLFAFLDAETDKAVLEMKTEKGPKVAKTMERAAPYENETDKNGDETGKVVVNFTMPAIIRNKEKTKEWKLKPVIFDARATPLPEEQEVGGGSTIKVSYELAPFYVASSKKAGVSRRLVAVQVLDLKVWGGSQNASDFGFGEEEGFTVNEPSEEATTAPAGATSSDF